MPLALESHDTEKRACELPPTTVGSKTRKFVFTRLQLSAHIYKSIWEAAVCMQPHRCFITGLSCLVSLPLFPSPTRFPSPVSLFLVCLAYLLPLWLLSSRHTRLGVCNETLSGFFDWTAVDVGKPRRSFVSGGLCFICNILRDFNGKNQLEKKNNNENN